MPRSLIVVVLGLCPRRKKLVLLARVDHALQHTSSGVKVRMGFSWTVSVLRLNTPSLSGCGKSVHCRSGCESSLEYVRGAESVHYVPFWRCCICPPALETLLLFHPCRGATRVPTIGRGVWPQECVMCTDVA